MALRGRLGVLVVEEDEAPVALAAFGRYLAEPAAAAAGEVHPGGQPLGPQRREGLLDPVGVGHRGATRPARRAAPPTGPRRSVAPRPARPGDPRGRRPHRHPGRPRWKSRETGTYVLAGPLLGGRAGLRVQAGRRVEIRRLPVERRTPGRAAARPVQEEPDDPLGVSLSARKRRSGAPSRYSTENGPSPSRQVCTNTWASVREPVDDDEMVAVAADPPHQPGSSASAGRARSGPVSVLTLIASMPPACQPPLTNGP